jgi:hypothetical protein
LSHWAELEYGFYAWLGRDNRAVRGFIGLMNARRLGFVMAFVACMGLGYWLARTAVPKVDRKPAAQAEQRQPAELAEREGFPKTKVLPRNSDAVGDREASELGALEGERVLIFKDEAGLARFLERAAGKLRIISRLDALRALRVGFADRADFERLLDGSENESFVFPVVIPGLPEEIGRAHV